jgi:thiosulfate/3-mercaptopyruvate sulfurtransferase
MLLALASALLLPAFGAVKAEQVREIPAIVSTDWLAQNLDRPGLVIIDTRSPEEYGAGHIPGSINIPEASWYTNAPFTVPPEVSWMELPPKEQLFNLLGSHGISSDSLVVIVSSTSGPVAPVPLALYRTAGAARVAITLLYAGVKNVALLDGGFDKWKAEGRPVTTVAPSVKSVTYRGAVKEGMIVTKDYVAGKIGKAVIIDARDLVVYLGFVQEPWTARVGHIPTARNLPTPLLYELNIDPATGEARYTTFKSLEFVKSLVSYVVGEDKGQEIIVYCGVGGYASTMYFVLSEVLGYTNVKMYDGSAQEWSHDFSLPMVYEGLVNDYASLKGLYTSLSKSYSSSIEEYTKLQGEYFTLRGEYSKLQEGYKELQAKYEALATTSTPLYLTIVFVATTIIFLALSIYFAAKVKAAKKAQR